jgi:hypothetical protein
MKKVKFEGKLSLNKETIAKLNQNQMGNVRGGDGTNDAVQGANSYYLCSNTGLRTRCESKSCHGIICIPL